MRRARRLDPFRPGTYTYLFALLVTSWSLRGVDPRLADALIRSQSTNLDNLTDRPLQVLVASAFWTSGTAIPWQLLLRFTSCWRQSNDGSGRGACW